MKKIVNLTPHEVVVEYKDGMRKSFHPSGEIARVEMKDEQIGVIDGIPVYKGKIKKVTGIPKKQDGVYYIVSLFVLQHTNRDDLIAPDTNGAIRDDEGKIIAVRGWRK